MFLTEKHRSGEAVPKMHTSSQGTELTYGCRVHFDAYQQTFKMSWSEEKKINSGRRGRNNLGCWGKRGHVGSGAGLDFGHFPLSTITRKQTLHSDRETYL